MTFKAHECFCYRPHYEAVAEFLRDVGSNPKVAALNPVGDPRQLSGLRHVSFFTVKNHLVELPSGFDVMLHDIGAVVIEINDSFEREQRLHVEPRERLHA